MTATASLTFVLSGGDLVFSGVDDSTPLGLLAMNEPALQPRITYADDSPHVEGSLATQAVWQQSMLNATVDLKATSEAALEGLKAQLRAAVGQFRYVVVTRTNGLARSWTADTGSMVLASDSLDVNELEEFSASYNLSIPVRPTAEVL